MAMICPKCGHPSDNFTSCSHCGIIFSKFTALQDRQHELDYERRERNRQRSRQFLSIGSAIVAITLGAIGFSSCENEPDAPEAADTRQLTPQQRAEASLAKHMGEGYYLWQSGEMRFVASDDIEQFKLAKNRFISIVLGKFGVGPRGFLITRECHAIIGTDLTRDELQRGDANRVANSESTYALYHAKLSEAERRYDEHRKAFIQRCKDCSQQAFDSELAKDAEQVDKLKRHLASLGESIDENRAEYSAASRFEVKTAFGTYPVRVIETNASANLSLIKLEHDDCDYLPLGDIDNLQAGERVYAFTDTTSKRLNAGTVINPDDSPITHNIDLKPGDMGMPLMNHNGEVIAVTTARHKQTRQAIPIHTALRMLRMPL